jgi:multidrug efflux pump subunit AcrB
MIGFIALAGIVLRNSILLVDFIPSGRAQVTALGPSLMRAGDQLMRGLDGRDDGA